MEIILVKSVIHLFLPCLQTPSSANTQISLNHGSTIPLLSINIYQPLTSLQISLWLSVNPFPNEHLFSQVQYKSFENTVKKGEIAQTSTFSFSNNAFYHFGELSALFIKSKIALKLQSLEEPKICCSGKC